MGRRITSLAALLLCLPLSLRAADVVVVLSADLPPYQEAADGVRSALEARGGDGVRVVSLEGRQERWAAVAEQIAEESPRVVVPIGSLATVLAGRKLEEIPIVYTMILNPGSLLKGAPAERAITGVSMNANPAQVFREMRGALPKVRAVGALFDPARSSEIVDEARIAAASVGIRLEAVPVGSTRELPDAVREVVGKDIDALWLFVDRTVLQTREGLELIMLESLRQGVPVVAPSDRYVKAGALLALGIDYSDLGAQTGELVGRLLEEEGDLPAPERPRTLEITVNEKVREALGIQLPSDFRNQVARYLE